MTILYQQIPGRWTDADEMRFRALQVRRAMIFDAPTSPAMGERLARRSDPVSSHAAGVQVSDKISDLYTAILAWLGPMGDIGGTSLEIAEGIGLERVTVSPRLAPMEKLGLVARTKERRAGPAGVSSIVWVAL